MGELLSTGFSMVSGLMLQQSDWVFLPRPSVLTITNGLNFLKNGWPLP
jgi:hypothetical protein